MKRATLFATAETLELAEAQGFRPSPYPGARIADSVPGVPAPIDLASFA